MSTTPQMNPSTMGQQYGQQQYGRQHEQQHLQQGPTTAPMSAQGQQIQFPLAQQMRQLGQQQPYQQLLQQLGGQHQQGLPLVLPSTVDAQAVVSGIATKYWDVVTPFPGQPSILYLFINNVWRQLVNPNQITHDQVQEAFTFGHQVIAWYDEATGSIQAVVINKQ